MVYAAALPSDCLRLVYHHLPLRSFARCLATCRGWNLHDEASDPLWLAVAHAHAKRQGRHPPDEWLELHPGWSHFRCADAVGDELRLRSATARARWRPRAMPPPDGLRRRARQADERCRRRSVEKDKRCALECFGVEGGGPDLGGNPGQRGEEQERSMGSSSSGWRSRRSERSERSRRRERSRRSESSERSGKSERSGRSRGATGWEGATNSHPRGGETTGGRRGVSWRWQ